MADPPSDFPAGLRPPAGGDLIGIGWRADLGEGIRVGDLADHLHDLNTTVSIGERWGVVLARAAARAGLVNQLFQEGPGAIEQLARELGYSGRELRYLRYLEEWWWTDWPRRGPFGYPDPSDLLMAISDTRAQVLLGTSMRVSRAEYHNPLEILLTGSGFIILGTIYAVRLVRDWSSARRVGEGKAREREATARKAEASADLFEWLVEEAKAGRLQVPPGDLLNAVPPSELPALDRLSRSEVSLELPENLDILNQDTERE